MIESEPGIDGHSLSPEVALILACCRWPRSEERKAAISRAAQVRIEWPRLLIMARKHRVEGFVHEGLLGAEVRPPDAVRAELRRRSVHIAARSLVLARATLAIGEAFEAGGIPALFVKGSSVEMLAYRELGLKSAHDIDVLVDRADFAAASDVLRGSGYERTIPPASLKDDLLMPYLDLAKDVVFAHDAQMIQVELHHRLGWHETLARIGVCSPRQYVEIFPGRSVQTLAREELFIYLSVHGAACRWMRIKWLADLAGFLSHIVADEVDSLHDVACERGAGRFAGEALRLCHHLLGTPLSQPLLRRLDADRGVRRLCAGSLVAIENARAKDTGLRSVVGSFVHELRMRGDWRSRFKALRLYLVSPSDMAVLRLPRGLRFLYYLTRLPLFVARRASGRLR